MANLAFHLQRKRRKRRQSRSSADGQGQERPRSPVSLPALAPELQRLVKKYDVYRDPDRYLSLLPPDNNKKTAKRRPRVPHVSSSKADELSLPSLVTTKGAASWESSRLGGASSTTASGLHGERVERHVMKGKEVGMVFPSIVKHFREAMTSRGSRRSRGSHRHEEREEAQHEEAVAAAAGPETSEHEDEEEEEGGEEEEGRACGSSSMGSLSSLGSRSSGRGGHSRHGSSNSQGCFSEFSPCLRPKAVYLQERREYEARRHRALRRQQSAQKANERRIRAMIKQKEERRAKAQQLEALNRRQQQWLAVVRACNFLEAVSADVQRVLSEKREQQRLAWARKVIFRALMSSKLAVAFRRAGEFRRKIYKSRWRVVLFIRIYRRRLAVKRLATFLLAGKGVHICVKAQQVVKELFKELRVVQHFARGFLECTQARVNALSGVWEKIEGEHLKELAARMEKNSKMAPLSQSFVRTIAMQKFVNEVNSKLIRGWMQTDSAYQALIRRQEQMGRVTLKIRGLGSLPVIPASVRDPLLRQMVVARRQAYRQAVRDHQRRAEEARKAGKRFGVEDVKRMLFSSDGVQAYAPEAVMGAKLEDKPKFLFYRSSSYGQVDAHTAVKRAYLKEFRKAYGDLGKRRGIAIAEADPPGGAMGGMGGVGSPMGLAAPVSGFVRPVVAGAGGGGMHRMGSTMRLDRAAGPRGPELIEI